ncbi:hypothetical protein RAC89_09190 [Paenibacillus sp. GD4]|uniref:hypothetical protein n=1 Tax=Paenibacillus sp. GD4 TaxID=3068890 RepID=UPI002796607F|nr:hypothetical protein [Paenibacillus sp. GD4]MDQ1910648.1 hypothetical protein [Paenibacillus sp. GD4]
MNSIFIYVFGALLLVTVLMDIQRIKTLKRSMRRLHLLVYVATLALFACIVLDIDVPMPTGFFIDNVSPWVFKYIHPS